MTVVLVATRNRGKLLELRPLLAAADLEAIDLEAAGVSPSAAEDAVERYATFAENALAKARYFHEASGGLPTLADDSGLAVDALGGEPGVRSRRWSGRTDLSGAALDAANNAQLQAALAGIASRAARFVCAAAFVDGALEVVGEGETTGRLLDAPRGSKGFGYDPYFLSDELGVTFAEAEPAAKAEVSHRGRAVRAVIAELARVQSRGSGS
ncbi:MAG TPA: non-canonical purine NTP pyrophosphatase [Gemmatimonadaceae bacterium]|nr:non-canonical purine NTP pyrophosphatase [Gemmatimonadaceae bacterium]